MSDFFAVMGLPRSAWLDGEVLKERFHRLSAERHPDAPGGSGAAFSALNEAWQALREPVSRLRHFLELTAPESLAGSDGAPAELGDLFMDIATLKQLAGAMEKPSSPLARALLEPRRLALLERFSGVETRLTAAVEQGHGEIRNPAATAPELAATLGRLTFLSHWGRQMRELRLALDS